MKSESGATFVEFSFIASFFILTIVVTSYLLIAFLQTTILAYQTNLAVRQAVIDTYRDDLQDPSAYITAALAPGTRKMGVKIDNVTICLVATLPACTPSPIPQGQLFMVRVEAERDAFFTWLGQDNVIWSAGLNSNPVGIESVI